MAVRAEKKIIVGSTLNAKTANAPARPISVLPSGPVTGKVVSTRLPNTIRPPAWLKSSSFWIASVTTSSSLGAYRTMKPNANCRTIPQISTRHGTPRAPRDQPMPIATTVKTASPRSDCPRCAAVPDGAGAGGAGFGGGSDGTTVGRDCDRAGDATNRQTRQAIRNNAERRACIIIPNERGARVSGENTGQPGDAKADGDVTTMSGATAGL